MNSASTSTSRPFGRARVSSLGCLIVISLTLAASSGSAHGQEAGPPDRLAVLGQDAVPDVVISSEFGTFPTTVLSGTDGGPIGAGFPFGPVSGGARIALGDLTGDGVPDIVAGRGPGGGLVQLFNGATIAPLGGGYPFGSGFAGGVFVAVGDVNGDGTNDIIVAQGAGGGEVRAFSGIGYGLLFSLRPFGASSGGVTVAAGDFTGDGRADLIVGQSGGSLVSVVDGATRQPIVTGAPFGSNFSGGVFVAAGDVNGDGRADAILAPGRNGGTVLVYDLATVSQIGRFTPYGASGAGVRVAASDLNGDGRAEIITGPGAGGGSSVRVFSGAAFTPLWSVDGYGASHAGGVLVAAPIASSIRFTSAAQTTFTTGQAGTFTVTTTAAAGVASVTSSGTLPAGVTFTDLGNGTARLSGTPAANSGGRYALTFTATAPNGASASQSFELIVNGAPAITSANSVTFTVLTSSSFTVRSAGFPTTRLQASGTLPSGITFVDNGNNTATLSGTPATGTAGTYPLTLTAANDVAAAATQAFTLTIARCAATLSPPAGALPGATFGGVYAQTLMATPGSGYTFAVTAGALPPGLSLSDSGVLTGSPAAGGTFSFTVAATSADCTASGAYSITVGPNAADDNYSGGVGNTQFRVGTGGPSTPAVIVAGSVLANDTGAGALTTGPSTIASQQGGTVAMAANGTFTYTPPAGFAGPSDQFTYTLTDGSGAVDTGTVRIAMSNVVWYVVGSGPAGSGQSHNPFNSMSAAAAAAQAGHVIYVSSGTAAGTTALKTGQSLRGAGVPFVLNGLSLPAGSAPTLLGSVLLADQVQVGGLSVNGGASPAVQANGLVGTVIIDGVAITGGSVGLELIQSSGSVTVNGGSISGIAGAAVHIAGGAGAVNIGASIASTGNRSVHIENRTGGTVVFSSAITDSGGGILLTNNPLASITFAGGMTVATTGSNAFSATGGGTVTVTQSGAAINTLSSVAGTALEVINTQIGAAGLTFQRINAGGPTLSAGNGIHLENTGVSVDNGGLRVTGNGAAQTGGFIRRKSGADGTTASGIGIFLQNTKTASFSWIEMNNLANGGIVGRNVAGFELHDSILTGPIGTTTAAAEAPISFGVPIGLSVPPAEGLVGTGLIRNTRIEGGVEHNVAFYNHAAAMQLRIDRTNGIEAGCLIANTAAGTGADGLHVVADGTASATVVVDQCRLRNNRQSSALATGADSATVSLTVTSSEFVGAGLGQNGVLIGNSGAAHVTGVVASTLFSDYLQSGVRVLQSPLASASSLLQATITDNTLNQFPSASDAAVSVRASSLPGQAALARVLLRNNFVRQLGLQPGFVLDAADAGSSPAVHLTLTANHIDMDTPSSPTYPDGPRGPIGMTVRATQAAQATICASTAENISHWYPPAVGVGGGITLEQANAAIVQLERGVAPIGSSAAAVLQANNSTSETSVLGSVAVVESGTCQVPGAFAPTLQ